MPDRLTWAEIRRLALRHRKGLILANLIAVLATLCSVPIPLLLPLPVDRLDTSLDVEPPALIKGYLRLGAKILGAPAWDPDFNAADLPMMMRIADLPSRYRKHFLGA